MVTMVIGGTGFIGLNIAERLLTEGKTTVLFDQRPLPAAARRTTRAAHHAGGATSSHA